MIVYKFLEGLSDGIELYSRLADRNGCIQSLASDLYDVHLFDRDRRLSRVAINHGKIGISMEIIKKASDIHVQFIP